MPIVYEDKCFQIELDPEYNFNYYMRKIIELYHINYTLEKEITEYIHKFFVKIK